MSGGALFGVLAAWVLAGAALAQPAAGALGREAQDLVFGDTPAIGPGPLKAYGEVIYTAMERPVLLFHYFSLEPDCRPVAVGIRLVEAPEHGAVSFNQGAEQPSSGGKPIYVRDDPRSHCDDRLVATDDASYAPAPGFSGHDRVVVEFTDRDEVFTDTIEVNVVSLKPEKPPRRVRRR